MAFFKFQYIYATLFPSVSLYIYKHLFNTQYYANIKQTGGQGYANKKNSSSIDGIICCSWT